MDEFKRYSRWEEVVVSNDKGRREVHYYLKDTGGGSDLAVVGKERSLRHMSYEASSRFLRSCHVALPSPSCSPLMEGSPAFKWKTRREVIDWLSSLVSESNTYGSSPMVDRFTDCEDTDHTEGPSSKGVCTVRTGPHSRGFSWLGAAWSCKKRRKHYRSFCRRGITISVHDFVYVMAEDKKRLVAYVEDLYEDSRSNNMVVVRWFHRTDELPLLMPPESLPDSEIFLSPCLQDLSVECIDGLASVLGPYHFDEFHSARRHVSSANAKPFLCRRQLDNDEIKAFDITQLQGYWSQEALRTMFTAPSLKLRLKISRNGEKRKRQEEKAKCQMLPGQHVEVLSQDSGIRGCWFRCVILRRHCEKIKVQYLDLEDADGAGNLEEWVLFSRVAAADGLGIRASGRPMVRPVRSDGSVSASCMFDVGSVVDARWHDGWWEGIVIRLEWEGQFQVYFPGEKQVSVFNQADLRHSQDWVGEKWDHIKERKDVAIAILSNLEGNNKGSSSELNLHQAEIKIKWQAALKETPPLEVKGESCSPDLEKDVKLDGLKWSSRKRRRFSPNHSKRSSETSSGGTSHEELEESSACGGFVLPKSLTVDQENCKVGGDPLFSAPISISNLVMSQ